MKNHLLIAAASALLISPVAAFAADPTGTVTINGSVAANCVVTAPAAETIDLGELADSVTGLYNNAADTKFTTLGAFCNGANSTMSVQANAIVLQGTHTTPTGFTDRVNYTATASVTPAGASSPVTTSDASNAAAATAANVGLFNDTITVTLSDSTTAASGLLIAGSYQGTTVVTLSPTV